MAFKIDGTSGPQEIIDDSGNLLVEGHQHEQGEFPYVTIGTQTWMRENLNVTHYRDGTSIPCIGSETAEPNVWENLSTGACTSYHGYPAWEHQLIYGLLYNWYAVNNSAGLAPAGWHIPSDAEWTTLEDYCNSDNDGSMLAGEKYMWLQTTDPYPVGGNSDFAKYDFRGLPSGHRQDNGYNTSEGSHAYWWSSDENGSTNGWYRTIRYNNNFVTRWYANKTYGFGVRCIRDN